MKHIIVLVILMINIVLSYGQRAVGSQALASFQALKVGDKIPDISLGEVENNYTGKSRFSEFRGKLIILDFWDIYCTSCIAAFPKMQKLQEKFGDRVQIFLVNAKQTKEQINRAFLNRKIQSPNLPSITNAKVLGKLFPHKYVPHHVWIDAEGVIRLIGHSINTKEGKIRDLLEGKLLSYIKPDKDYDSNHSLSNMINAASKILMKYQSTFTIFNDDYGLGGGKAENIVDIVNDTIRNTYINRDVLQLYQSALGDSLKKSWNNIILGPYSLSYLDGYQLLVSDTLKYTTVFLANDQLTGESWAKSHYCYEQVTPVSMTKEKRQQYMLQDLNRYFGDLYGTEGKLEKIKLPIYLLVCNSMQDRLRTKGETPQIVSFIENGKRMVNVRNQMLRYFIMDYLQKVFVEACPIVLDETNMAGNIDIIFPHKDEIHNLEELRKALQSQGLDLIQSEREMDIAIIREKQ